MVLDQSFSAENFRRIIDYENRRGVYLEGMFFPDIEEVTKEIKSCVGEIKELKKIKGTLSLTDYEEKKSDLNSKKNSLKEKKEALLMEELNAISDKVTNSKFSLDVSEIDIGGSKTAYTVGGSAPAYFAMKQVQYNIRKLYKSKQSNRHHIVSQVREVLSNEFPKYVIRTDISSFYESIPRCKLWEKINNDTLLTLASKKIIKQVLREYEALSGSDTGIPRGVGVSAYLAELYMRDFDREIRKSSEVIYYARYVDDIFIVYSPEPNSDHSNFLKDIKEKISKLHLSMNPAKTQSFYVDGSVMHSVDYLGYRFKFGNDKARLSLTKEKVGKYKERIDLCFNKYDQEAKYDETRARRNLRKRVKFLTGNTRLLNNKKNAVVGVYFSNCLLNYTPCLKYLDLYLKKRISDSGLSSFSGKYSFIQGFDTKKFHNFSEYDLKQIVEVWKYAS